MTAPAARSLTMQRSVGAASLAFKKRGAATVIDRLYQGGSAKIRFPRAGLAATKDAVLINTSGGITDGDRFSVTVDCAPFTSALVTSQAAERVYKAVDIGNPAELTTDLKVADGASLIWLPQETILVDGGSVRRRLTLDVAEGARAVAAESYAIGRTAMGETVTSAYLLDRWTVRYGDRLVYTDSLKLDGDISGLLAEPAVTCGATIFATLVYIGPDAQDRLAPLRAALASVPATAGCSLRAPVLIVRMIAPDIMALHQSLLAAATVLAAEPDHVATRLARQWFC